MESRIDDAPPSVLHRLFRREPESGAIAPAPDWGYILSAPSALRRLAEEPGAVSFTLGELLPLVGGERAFLVERTADSDRPFRVIAAVDLEGDGIRNPEEKIIPVLLTRCLERAEGAFFADLASSEFAPQLARERQPKVRSILMLPFSDLRTILVIDHRFQPLRNEADGYYRFLWLYSLLEQRLQSLHARQALEELTEELRDLRRTSRGRRTLRGADEADRDPALPAAVSGENPRSGSTSNGQDARGLRGDFRRIIGTSPELLEVLQVLDKVSSSQAPIHIFGESGTGKELIARSIHANSTRASGPFVSENCAALAETLLETELFGHVKGAYTGATDDRPGLFELASGGTLFLDEVGETSPGMQKKLLRAIQEGVIRRVGGEETIRVDVRIISATNKELIEEVAAGRFREDLFYRLNVIHVALPPLRSRKDDVPALVQNFVEELNLESGASKHYSDAFVSVLLRYDWPGNVRELQNQLRRVHALSDEILDPDLLSAHVLRVSGPGAIEPHSAREPGQHASLRVATERLERSMIEESLERHGGHRAQVCLELGIPKTTLYSKLKKYGLEGWQPTRGRPLGQPSDGS